MGDEDGEQDDLLAAPTANGAVPDDLTIEGLRLPFTRGQRLRRAGIVTAALLALLAILLWPTVAALPDFLRPSQAATRATATPDFSSHPIVEVTYIAGPSGSLCPTTPLVSTLQGSELHAETIGSGDVWALLPTGPRITMGHATKIVWRATGSGAFSVVALDASGTILSPQSGPDLHPGGSNWPRPGDEWGTAFDFPQPGCWELRATRGQSLTAMIWVAVTPS